MFERFDQAALGDLTDTALVDALEHHTRTEAKVAAQRLATIAEITARHCDDEDDTSAHQIIDGWETAAATISAACNLTRSAASTQMRIAQALRERLPKIAAAFAHGDIPAKIIATITWRTQNIQDNDALTLIDTALAGAATTYSALSTTKAEQAIDTWIHKFDPTAVRKTRTAARDRNIHFGSPDDPTGTTSIWGKLLATDAALLHKALNTMAHDVCDNDPRTLGQRRTDALGTLATGTTHLTCQCGSPDCTATGTDPRSRAFVIHLLTQTLPTTSNNDGDGDGDGNRDGDGDGDGDGDPSDTPTTADRNSTAEPEEPASTQAPHEPAASRPSSAQTRDPRIHGNPSPDYHADTAPTVTGAPAVILGGSLVPTPLLAELLATGATVKHLDHPDQFTAEHHYRPSTSLATFIRLRDQRCMFPGCGVAATYCDLDHTVPWPAGSTHPGNLGPKCRKHHLLKTFNTGWTDQQHPDGSHTWTAPTGHTYRTTPFSQILFPDWNPVTPAPPSEAPQQPPAPRRDTKMPLRKRTRQQARTTRINTERRLNTELDKPPPY